MRGRPLEPTIQVVKQGAASLGHPDRSHTHTSPDTHARHADLLTRSSEFVEQCANLSRTLNRNLLANDPDYYSIGVYI